MCEHTASLITTSPWLTSVYFFFWVNDGLLKVPGKPTIVGVIWGVLNLKVALGFVYLKALV